MGKPPVDFDMQMSGDSAEYDGSVRVRVAKSSPFPPMVTPTYNTNPGNRLPKWMDKDGVLWSSHMTDGLYKSTDYGETWTFVQASPRTDIAATALIMTDTGRAIWCIGSRWFYVSNEAKSSWTTAFTFDVGYVSTSYGFDKYKNVIVISAYGDKNGATSPSQVVISKDDGATWSLIYDGGDMAGYHIHTVAIDPWAGNRIWISEGDVDRRQIVYSDDYGTTWRYVYNDGDPTSPVWGQGIQPTQIIPTPHGVLFGTDQAPDGFHFWKRPQGILQPEVDKKDISQIYTVNGSSNLEVLMVRGWYNIDTVEPTYLFAGLPADSAVGGYSRIFASVDGMNIYNIWTYPTKKEYKPMWIVGPHVDDPNRTFWVTIQKADGNYVLMTAQFPQFL